MEPAQLQLLVAIHKDQTSIIYNVWSIYQGLSMILIGYAITQDHIRQNPRILSIISIAIFLFSFGNRSAILRSQLLVEAAAQQLRNVASHYPDMAVTLSRFDAPETTSLLLAHWVLTLFLTIGPWIPYAIWWNESRHKNDRKSDNKCL